MSSVNYAGGSEYSIFSPGPLYSLLTLIARYSLTILATPTSPFPRVCATTVFRDADAFNQDISSWDMSSVNYMGGSE